MTPHQMAALYALAFESTRAWRTDEIETLLSSPYVFSVFSNSGFALGRIVVDEAELLAIAVHPSGQRCGQGRFLLTAFEDESHTRGAIRAYLEVAMDNIPARRLYESAGYTLTSQRPAYYARAGGKSVAAGLMNKLLPSR